MKPVKIFNITLSVFVVIGFFSVAIRVNNWLEESRILRQVIERLSADSRVAEVLVTKSEYDEVTREFHTTIKFLEFDSGRQPTLPKYFTFEGNVIQFQTLVIRFQDELISTGDRLKGKSAYLFMKAFVLDGENTQEFTITEAEEIPQGYKIPDEKSSYENNLWKEFWNYALDPQARERAGIKNAQIEAPGSVFVPGTIYTLKIEHDGGLRIDAQPVPEILKGENL